MFESRKNCPWKNGPREKWSPEKWSPRKMVPGKIVRGKLVSGKMFPENWSPGNSETKDRGASVEHRGVYVECWNVINLRKSETRQQTENSETNPKLGDKKSRGERRASWCVCGMFECVINLIITMTYLQLETRIMHHRKQILTYFFM